MSLIRRSKLAMMIYNLLHRKQLVHNLPLYQKYGIQKKYFEPVSSEDFRHLPKRMNTFDRLDSASHLELHPRMNQSIQPYLSNLRHWSRDGYAILPQFFEEDHIDRMNADIDTLRGKGSLEMRETDNRITFAYRQSTSIAEAGNHPTLKAILSLLLDQDISLFQSINFLKGSQQATHSDSIHMTTYPLGNLIAAWVALEDITIDNGPLHYYPGSHRLPYILNRDIDNLGSRWWIGAKDYHHYESYIAQLVIDKGLQKQVFLAQKGDVLIWHANLLHGGEPVGKPDSTRKSVVFHYYANDAICYHEITQRPSLRHLT